MCSLLSVRYRLVQYKLLLLLLLLLFALFITLATMDYTIYNIIILCVVSGDNGET